MKKIFLITLFAASSANAAEYNLFNPTPDDKLRPFTTERPSKTDSVFTIDPGHLVIETSLYSHIHNDDAGLETNQNILGAGTTLRLGVSESNDIQLVFDAYKDVSVKSAGAKDDHNGYGDTLVRFKHNFIGNDGEDFGLAIIPYIKLPTNTDNLGNDDVEGGVGLPFNYNMANGFSLSGMTQFNIYKDQADSGYYMGYANALVLGKSFTDKLSGYTEFYTFLGDTGERDWQDSLDFGVVYAATDNIHIDTGVNFGVTQAADDVNYFVGAAFRF